MKQRPILFNGAMVRAILNGQKTQTRRIVKPHGWTTEQMSKYEFAHVLQAADAEGLTCKQPAKDAYAGFNLTPGAASPTYFKCPFGTIGDQLWLREVFSAMGDEDKHAARIFYKADGDDGLPWTPSIHMPRWASRITLEITSIRVERLQDISEKDAAAEGFAKLSKDDGTTWKYGIPDSDGLPGTDDSGWPWSDWEQDSRNAFKKLWHSIGGDWEANPWVWVIEFKRVEQ